MITVIWYRIRGTCLGVRIRNIRRDVVAPVARARTRVVGPDTLNNAFNGNELYTGVYMYVYMYIYMYNSKLWTRP